VPRSLSGDVFQKASVLSAGPKRPLAYFRGSADLTAFAAAKVFGIHLRTAFPPISRAPRGFTVGEGPLAAASPQTPWLGGNSLRASLGDLLVI
jgi:hypothetical protein